MNSPSPRSPLLHRLTSPLAMAMCAIVAITAALIYSRLAEVEKREAARLETIAESHAREIGNWLHHRMKETEFVLSSSLMAELFQKWERSGDAHSLEVLIERAKSYREANEYESALIVDDRGNTIARDIEPPVPNQAPSFSMPSAAR